MKFFIPLLSLLFVLFVRADDELCPTVRINDLKKLKLTENERRLLCGDKEEVAFRDIPFYQAKYFLTGFLQSRGYLKPVFTEQQGVLHVNPGPLSKIKKIKLTGPEPGLKKEVQTELRHLYRRRILETRTLDSLEAEGLAQIRNRGHPCAKVKSVADIDQSIVHLSADNGPFHNFGEVKKEEIVGLRENALNRYYPFIANEPFKADLLKLTEKRMTRAEVVQGTYFLEKCDGKEFELSQNFITGPPRTLRYGAGASTELGPMTRVRWSHNRFKSMASQLSATAQASLRSQSLNLSADSFLWHDQPRRSLLSQVEVLHERQLDYEQLIYSVRPLLKWTRDSEGFHKLYTLGPSYEGGTFDSSENSSTRSFGSGTVLGSLQWMSHDYELFDILPQKGQLYTTSFDFRHPTLGFGAPLLKWESHIVHVGRLSTWGRGFLVGALRLNPGTTWVSSENLSLEALPPSVKFFGGGSDDIRGFFLRTLPKNDGLGALTKLALKSELRKTHFFTESLEAFAFLDGGYFSERSWTLDRKLYYSPGLGLRWLSPIGMVQTYGARALTRGPNEDLGNLFYVGIGGTF